MPYTMRKVGGKYSVSSPTSTHAKGTTKKKAEAQMRLLRGIEYSDWKPTGKKAKK